MNMYSRPAGQQSIPAATVMILRDTARGPEVLMLKRNRSLKFAPGFWVFPGGRIDRSDFIDVQHEKDAAINAAVRECLEECGVTVRHDKLIPFYHWTTPEGGKRRFGTWFFHTKLDDPGQEVTIDGQEIVSHQWIHPQRAFDLLFQGAMPMLPPTLISLLRIKNCSDYLEVDTVFSSSGIITVSPVVDRKNGKVYSMYSGDAGYESGDSTLVGPRHRLIIQFDPFSVDFEFTDCPEQVPVTGKFPIDFQ